MSEQFATQSQIDTLASLKQRSAEELTLRTQVESRAAKDSRLRRKHDVFAFFLLIGVVLALLYSRVLLLQKMYSLQFAWYDGKKVGKPIDGKYGAKRGERGKGSVSFSMNCVCIKAVHPALFGILNFFGTCETLTAASSLFLLLMVQHFQDDLQGIHWDGNEEQLKHSRLPDFLSSYSKWTSKDNVWSFLYPSQGEFTLSVAVQQAKGALPGSYLDSLFRGGLCKLAVDHASKDDSAIDMALKLLGEKIVYHRTCEGERLQAAMNTGAQALTVGSVGVYLGRKAVRRVVANAVGKRIGDQAVAKVVKGVTVRAVTNVTAEGVTSTALSADAVTSFIPVVDIFMWFFTAVSIISLVATTAVVGSNTYKNTQCLGGDFYVRVRNKDGSYTETKWEGNPDHLPTSES